MVDSDLIALAKEWIAHWSAVSESKPPATSGDAFDRVWDICEDRPDKALPFILEVLRRDQSNKILEVLSAGPLEHILAKHGEQVIGQVEAEARSNPLFATLLGGVWKRGMPDHIWDRVQKVWDRRGWDGIPEEKPSK